MASATITTTDGILKSWYDDIKVKIMSYSESTLFSAMARMTEFGGDNLPIPIVYGIPVGRATSVSLAQQYAAPSASAKFTLTRALDYGVVSITNEALEASELGDKAAFLSARTTEIDGVYTSILRSLSTAIFGTGSGSIANVATSGLSTTRLTLSDPEQIVNFDVGQVVSASSADASGARTGSAKITSIDADNGYLYTGSNWTTQITGLADGDFLQVNGDLNQKVKGLAGWLPTTAPAVGGGDNWFGVDRSTNVTRLAGVRVTSAAAPPGASIEEKIMRGVARVAREGGRPDVAVVNYGKFADIQASMASRGVVQMGEVATEDGNYGFPSIRITTGTNVVDIVADPYCPTSLAYLLQLDTWKFYSLKDAPRFDNSDGLMMLRQPTADSVEVRVKYYGQVGCVAPGKNGVMSI